MTQFERDLQSSAAFRELCQDDDFARKLYCSLENQEWYYQADTIEPIMDRFACSFRYAGGLVADLRDKEEDYLDFYCGGPASCTLFPEVEEALAKLGWYPVKEDNREPEG